MADLKVDLKGLQLKNPVISASGCFGFGEEFADFIDIGKLGAINVKGTTLEPREGNAYPRMAETASGMLNAVGLQNKGVDYFLNTIFPRIKNTHAPIIVNVNGSTLSDYISLTERINAVKEIPAIELNISCPNVKMGGMAFGTNVVSAREVVREVRKVYQGHLMVKLSPNVTNIAEFALIAEEEGADSVSLINTLLAMAIDAKKRKPVLSTITGGLSGPAVKPIALRMVWQVSKAVKIPVIGMGGIMNATDAIEFILAGASAVQVGTANFIDPTVCLKIIEGINTYCEENGFKKVTDLIGALEV